MPAVSSTVLFEIFPFITVFGEDMVSKGEDERLPAVSSTVLFEIFPFIIVFGEDMVSKGRMKGCQLCPPLSSSRSSHSSSSSERTW